MEFSMWGLTEMYCPSISLVPILTHDYTNTFFMYQCSDEC